MILAYGIWHAKWSHMANSLTNTIGASLQTSPAAPYLERTHLKDQVTSLLREYIVKGKLKPGSKLVERELAEWLNISRMPVHDALVQLEKEGLVVTKTDARYVIELTRKDLYEMTQVRIVLERLAAEAAAKNSTPENRSQLSCLLQTLQEAVDHCDINAFSDGHMELHRTIWRQANNPHLQKALDSILGPILMFMASSEYVDWENTYGRHKRLVEAIQAGEPQAAGDCMVGHYVRSLTQPLESFD
jgi:DNA-binding GntR family transcriptional regulator